MKIKDENVRFPQNSQLFVAIGAAIHSMDKEEIEIFELMEKTKKLKDIKVKEVHKLKPLFDSEEDYESFKKRHSDKKLIYKDLKDYKGNLYLGIDAGLTTSKVVVIGENTEIAERSEEHTSELQSRINLVCRLLLEKKKINAS